ncbi:hypothetical protein EDI_269690 [Entamoeba dispar SAW760]|uniref:AVL9/DENND6 domain-containing protein n=1 Tax=Entamoeba dispar (strain ATCC PRA-260 / SAW760) TaxID=370354 RepID=B0ERP8_ENTDS|nr:uncharacterized protein EDI_269690 [Entamoeba dispar SAW760]EDR22811.1 hypothetical protein EDI_269690 [Entamoeba dispar SAW760]|eukprot:EDR22811.1 hypothetical protein EDI_269690 [Entamoeba dispar SAW760]
MTTQAIRGIVLLVKDSIDKTAQILYSTEELSSEEETFIITTSFPDMITKHPDYVYFNYKTSFYVSVIFNGRNEWEHKTLSLVGICTVPFLHQIRHILLTLVQAYQVQTKMINEELLKSFIPLGNVAFQPIYTSAPTAHALINRLDINIISLIKLFLLDYRVLIIASKEQVAVSSETILFLLSLVPGVFFGKPENIEIEKLQLPLSLNSEERPVYMHLTMDNFYRIGESNGIIACVSSPLVLQKSEDYDVVVDLSTGKFIYRENSISKSVEVTKTDKVFIFNVKQAITKYNHGNGKGNEGSNEWVFGEMTNYVLSLLNGLARNKEMFNGKPFKITGELEEVGVDYGRNFVNRFIRTNPFKEWQTKMEASGCINKSYERVHPTFSGTIGSNSQDMIKVYLNNEFIINGSIALSNFNERLGEWKRKRNEGKVNEKKEEIVQEKIPTKKTNESSKKEDKIKTSQKEEEIKENLDTEHQEKDDTKKQEDEKSFVDVDQPIDFFFS